MLVEAAWAAAKAPGHCMLFVRIRARRGHQIAAVAVARKLTVLCWHLLTKGEDYQWARPALVANEIRAMQLQADIRNRKVADVDQPALRHQVAARPRELIAPGGAEYERFVSQWNRGDQPARGRLSFIHVSMRLYWHPTWEHR